MAGATALEESETVSRRSSAFAVPQARRPEQAKEFKSFHNYVALPRTRGVSHRVLGARRGEAAADAGRARIQPEDRARRRRRQRHRPRGRAAARRARRARGRRRPERGECRVHLGRGAAAVVARAGDGRGPRSRRRATASPRRCARTILAFGGVDIVINTAAIYPTPDPSAASAEAVWAKTLHINVTGNYVLAEEAARVLKAQNLPAAMVFTSSANAIVPKSRQRGVRRQQGGGQSPDPRARHRPRPAGPGERHRAGHGHRRIVDVPARSRDRRPAEVRHRVLGRASRPRRCRTKLAEFYARRTITRRPILPLDCANAICWLAGDASAKTTGHVIPVDGGLPEAFLRWPYDSPLAQLASSLQSQTC